MDIGSLRNYNPGAADQLRDQEAHLMLTPYDPHLSQLLFVSKAPRFPATQSFRNL